MTAPDFAEAERIWQARTGPVPADQIRHVRDRHGYIWRVVRDGGMATRADNMGIITEGIVRLANRAGPLEPLEVADPNDDGPDPDWCGVCGGTPCDGKAGGCTAVDAT